jgi:DNA-binding MarR family transcriptional regulator/N-acetylglutamate synthase-like GNAT family acetyltransferase
MLFIGTMSCFDFAYAMKNREEHAKNDKITRAERKMTSLNANEMVEAVRRFQGFYARHVAAPHERLEQSHFSHTEVRVLYAVMRAHACTAAEIARQLELDTGYLSRLLMQFENRGLLVRRRSVQDKRRWLISLTTPGRAALEPSRDAIRQAVSEVIDALEPAERMQLVDSMGQVRRLLSPRDGTGKILLRGPRAGDFGWIVQRQAELAAGSPAMQRARETLAANVVAEFLTAPEPQRNACWIAEQDGVGVGAVVLLSTSRGAARLASLFVEPGARRLGVGGSLIDACAQFAAACGYEALSCLPDEVSEALARLLQRSGFSERDGEPGWHRSLRRPETHLLS